MFRSVTKTWNPYTGCNHDCTYCWAKDLILGRLRHLPKYRNGFGPTFHSAELYRAGTLIINKRFKAGDLVFVSSMGDLFGEWVFYSHILAILNVIRENPQADFLLQTKNPYRFVEIEKEHPRDIPTNVYLGTTIETNRIHTKISKAPPPYDRFWHMRSLLLRKYRRFLSIEPIMDFDLDVLVSWVVEMAPVIVEVGADNHNKHLPEPTWDKVEALLERLRAVCPTVNEKKGLERLKR